MALRSRSGLGGPSAGAQSVGHLGDPRASGESEPPRQGAPPVHLRTDAARWPHRATVRHAPAQSDPLTRSLRLQNDQRTDRSEIIWVLEVVSLPARMQLEAESGDHQRQTLTWDCAACVAAVLASADDRLGARRRQREPERARSVLAAPQTIRGILTNHAASGAEVYVVVTHPLRRRGCDECTSAAARSPACGIGGRRDEVRTGAAQAQLRR